MTEPALRYLLDLVTLLAIIVSMVAPALLVLYLVLG